MRPTVIQMVHTPFEVCYLIDIKSCKNLGMISVSTRYAGATGVPVKGGKHRFPANLAEHSSYGDLPRNSCCRLSCASTVQPERTHHCARCGSEKNCLVHRHFRCSEVQDVAPCNMEAITIISRTEFFILSQNCGKSQPGSCKRPQNSGIRHNDLLV